MTSITEVISGEHRILLSFLSREGRQPRGIMFKVKEAKNISDVSWGPGLKLVHLRSDQKWPDQFYSEEGYHVEIKAPLSYHKGNWVSPRGIYALADYEVILKGKRIKVRRVVHESDPYFLKVVQEML